VRSRVTPQHGFTVLELMIVVAIVGILAAVAIPSWLKESRKGKYDSEVNAMMTELALKEEQYKSEIGNGVYLAASACPSATSQAGVNFASTCITSGSAWQTLRVQPTDGSIRCTYTIAVGDPGSTAAAPTGFAAAPSTVVSAWYTILATCDMDGQGGTKATFLITSWDNKLQKLNYGK
jgi:prepilin-type N-terminal cleavage/methylation domain-containing protein